MENKNALNEISKGCSMGMDAIKFIMEKTEDNELEKALEIEYNKYKDIAKRIDELCVDPDKTNSFEKTMTWYSINMKTIVDNSTSKLAEILLQGTNMGIIEGRKILNNKDLDKKVKKLIEEFVSMQEDSVEKLKTFL